VRANRQGGFTGRTAVGFSIVPQTRPYGFVGSCRCRPTGRQPVGRGRRSPSFR